MDDSIIVVTSEDQKFYLKSQITRADKKAISRIMQSKMFFNPETGVALNLSVAEMMDASRETIEKILLQKVVLSDGSEADPKDFKAIIDNLLDEDESLLLIKANEVTKSSIDTKKNEMTS
jgi:hypothetical protein